MGEHVAKMGTRMEAIRDVHEVKKRDRERWGFALRKTYPSTGLPQVMHTSVSSNIGMMGAVWSGARGGSP